MRIIILLPVMIAAFLLIVNVVRAEASDTQKSISLQVDISDTPGDPDISSIFLPDHTTYFVQQDMSLSFPMKIYRGKTLKRTVYIWMEDSDRKRISSKQKFSLNQRFTAYNLSAGLNFSRCQESGQYFLVVEGLDLEADKGIKVEFTCEYTNKEDILQKENHLPQSGITFSVEQIPASVKSGTPFKMRLRINNPAEEYLEVDAWSYVYRSSRCYSGDREGNRVTVNLPAYSNVSFDLENTVEAKPGEYSVMIRFLRTDRKTPIEIKRNINVTGDADIDSDSSGGTSESLQLTSVAGDRSRVSDVDREDRIILPSKNISDDPVFTRTVYESSSAKARRYAGFFLILLLSLVLVALIMKKF